MKNKTINKLILMWFVLTQFLSPVPLVFAMELNDSDNTQFDLIQKKVENDEVIVDLIIDNSIDYDALDLVIPNEASYDLYDVPNEYDKETDTIKLHNINKNRVPMRIFNLTQGEKELELIVYNKGEVIDKKTLTFDVEGSTNEQNEDSLLIMDDIESSLLDANNLKEPDLQRDIKIFPVLSKTESGKDAIYKMVLKLTGSQVYYKDLKLVIDLPINKYTSFSQDLSDLKIDGVIPVYNQETNQLVYQFDSIQSGQTYETILLVNTENYYMSDGENLTAKASLVFSKEYEKYDQTSEGTVTLDASSAMSIKKTNKQILHDGEKSVAMLESDVQWEIRVSVPKKETGQMLLQPGSKIIVKDILPKGLSYNPTKLVEGTPRAQQSGQTLTWNLTVPSIEEQIKNPDYLFTQNLLFWTKVDNDKKLIDSSVTNTATVGGTFIDGVKRDPITQTSSDLPIYALKTNTVGGAPSGIILPEHFGPANGSAGIGNGGNGNSNNRNPDPAVYNDAYLKFAYDFFGNYYAAKHDMEELEIVYTIDKDLILESIAPPKRNWQQMTTIEEKRKNININDRVSYTYKISSVDKNGKTKPPVFFKETGKSKYNLNDMGLEKGDRVTEIRMIFDGPIPKGIGNYSKMELFFTVKPGYESGYVKNKLDVIGKSTYNPKTGGYSNGDKYYPFNWRNDFPEWYNTDNARVGDRTARIVKKPVLPPPIAKINVRLLESKSGIVEDGQNRLRVEFFNDSSSKDSLTKDLNSVVLLPPGVKVSETKDFLFKDSQGVTLPGNFTILDDNYNNSGRQLIKFEWDELYIRSGHKLQAEVNVDIYKNAPTALYFDVYGFSGDSKLTVPTVSKPTLTDTILQKDTDDLNKDGKKETPRIKSSNVYTILNTYDLKTEKFVKGPGEDWSKFAKTTPGGEIDYRLYLTNSTGKDISSMTLIDVLPAGGDLGITDNISRGSKFMPYLSGPIELPQEWKGKVNVFYSTSKIPKRDDLIRQTNYPKDTTPLGNPNGATDPKWMTESAVKDWTSIRSFKVELIPGAVWIKGVDMNITFKMEAPTVERASDKSIFDPKTDPRERAAWNSFAVATDNGQPVEPQQVGVYIDKDIGQLEIKKVDAETAQVLSGAEFEVSSEDGSLVKTIVSDDNGIAKLEDIPLGKYTIKETKSPNGYNISNKLETFEVRNEEYKHIITIKNQRVKGKLIIKKVDSITGKALSGAEFEVKNSKGEVIKTLTTDEKGLADVSDLADGKYSITEIKAPAGYNILQKPIDFEITLKNPEVTLTVKNTAVGWELPETGGSGILLSSVIGLMFMSVGLSLVRVRRI